MSNRSKVIHTDTIQVNVVQSWSEAVEGRRVIAVHSAGDDGIGDIPAPVFTSILKIASKAMLRTKPPFVFQTAEDDGGAELPLSLTFGVRKRDADEVFDAVVRAIRSGMTK